MTIDPPMPVEDQDEELLQAARNAREGDLSAFEALVERHRTRILANCRFLTRDDNNAEDLAQEVFVKAFFGLRGFEGRSTFRHWLQRIKVNHCLNHLKKRDAKGHMTLEDDGAESFEQLRVPALAEKELAALSDSQRIAAILNAMPDTLRIPLVMCDMDELAYDEIAASLGIGLSAVKMRIKRAREQFRRLYQEQEAAR